MPAPVVIFDGECAICNGAVRRLLQLDKKDVFRITGNGSEVGKALIARAGLPADITQSTIVVVEGTKSWTHSSAIVQLVSRLGMPWRLASATRVVPVRLRDAAYRRVAMHRKKIDGADAACGVPTPELRSQWQRRLATMEEFEAGTL
jgi:predicted DCC family thiol-disulfide oxidoreductase YuxK